MPRYVFPAGTVTNTTGAPLRLAFHATSSTGRREADLWSVDGSNNLVDRIPNGIILTDVAGAYGAFAGPEDIDTLYVQPHTGAARTAITATSLVAGQGGTYLNSTYAGLAQTAFRSGRTWMFVGDSITNGSTATNFVYSYTRQACYMAGTASVSCNSVEAGVPGATSASLLRYLPGWLSTYKPGAVHIQVGTNDAGTGVSVATFIANVTAMVNLAKAKGVAVTIGTVPPRGASSTDTIRRLVSAYNLWLRLWAPTAGVEVAEVYGALADPTSGDYLAAYNSGDDVHPNDAGHRSIARAVSAAMLRTMSTGLVSLVNSASAAVNLISNPLMVTAGTDPTGSFSVGATGTAATRSVVADTSGLLPAGKWAQAEINAAAASTFSRGFAINPALWAVGDTLGIVGMMQVDDVTGGGAWDAAVAAGTADIGLKVANGSTGVLITTAIDRCAGRVLSSGTYHIGQFLTPFVVPAGVTSMNLNYSMSAPNGLDIKARWGVLGVLNLTTLGLAPLVGSTSFMVNDPTT